MHKKPNGLETIRTLKNQVNRLRARTPQGALIELFKLEVQKERLKRQEEKCERELRHVRKGLREIGKEEEWLWKMAQPSSEDLGRKADSERPSPIHHNLKEMIIKY